MYHIPKRHSSVIEARGLLSARINTYCHAASTLWQDLVERRDQRLRQPEGKDELRPSHQHLWCQPFEERSEAFNRPHVPNNSEPTLWVLKVAVLYPGFDDIEGC